MSESAGYEEPAVAPRIEVRGGDRPSDWRYPDSTAAELSAGSQAAMEEFLYGDDSIAGDKGA